MLELVFANLKTRPLRTLISVVGVALGVVLVTLFTGLANGISNDMVRRASNWKAEIIFTRPGGFELQTGNVPVNTRYAELLRNIQGVEATIPVIRNFTADSNSKFGLKQLDGLNWDEFAAMNEMKLLRGRSPVANDEVILDEVEARNSKVDVGGTVQLFGDKTFNVVGIFAPPSGARTKMSLAAMQNALGIENNKCSYILVKIKNGERVDDVVARINQELPGNKIRLTSDLLIDAEQRFPILKTFLQVLVGLGAFVSIIFVLLSMYTTVTERRREIGILKSLGASKLFIIGTIEREALMVGILGTILGFAVSFLAAYLIQTVFELVFEFGWGGSLIGALYPALRAASLDPVTVLTNE
jgi:putative ABC transport system permease protein